MGAICVLFGVFPLLATFDIGPLGPDDINGPAWLGFASGGVFIAGGLAVMLGQSAPILTGLLGLLAMAGLASVGNWIGFGVGERACSGSFSLGWLGIGDQFSDLACRVPFGMGAMLLNGFLLLATVLLFQKALGGPPKLARLKRAAEIIVVLSFAPLLLIGFAILIVKVGSEAIMTRVKTGAWPRNEEFIARQKEKGLLKRFKRDKPNP
ncbi:MAG: hypothetical protein HQK86_11310 [Nitrospinae bacterium]|nr:hypothetical protein [Nitrospinota bacterium]